MTPSRHHHNRIRLLLLAGALSSVLGLAVARPAQASWISDMWQWVASLFSGEQRQALPNADDRTAQVQGTVKGETTDDGQVTFNPASGNLVIPAGQNSATISVTTGSTPASSYDLRFSGTADLNGNGTIDGDETRSYDPIVKLSINQPCSIPDDGDDPDAGECNDSSCYDANGELVCPLKAGCHPRWPRCQNFLVLKVRKDRQCDQWLDCRDWETLPDPSVTNNLNASSTGATEKTIAQCTSLGVCIQKGADGTCARFLEQAPSAQRENLSFASPDETNGTTSKIRWYSGYSSGFHFSSRDVITAAYPATDVSEVGLDGAKASDLVPNGNFEELRCSGSGRDGQACLTTSDCRIGTGVCTSDPEPVTPAHTSNVACTNDSDCADVTTTGLQTLSLPYCRYVSTWGTDIDCKNPLDTQWLGVIPPTDYLACSNNVTKQCLADNNGQYDDGQCTISGGTCQPSTQDVCSNNTSKSCTSNNDCPGTAGYCVINVKTGQSYCSNNQTKTGCTQKEGDANYEGTYCKEPNGTCQPTQVYTCVNDPGTRCDTDGSPDDTKCPAATGVCVSKGVEQAGFGWDSTTAGYTTVSPIYYPGAERYGFRTDAQGSPTVVWHVWEEDDSNFRSQPTLPQYPAWSPVRHVKDDNNVLKVEVQPGAVQGSGVGVVVASTTSPLTSSEDGYVLSFRFRYGTTQGTPEVIKAQLGLNYTRNSDAGARGYLATNVGDANERLQTVNLHDFTGTDEWQTFTLGGPDGYPLKIDPATYDATKAVVLQFVTGTHNNTSTPTVFYLDDVSLKPALEYAKLDASTEPLLINRTCRLYPKDNAIDCEYRDPAGTGKYYKGWRGYCLDRDPQNASLCLTWWPLDVLAGETALGTTALSGYNDEAPLYMCAVQAKGDAVFDQSYSVGSDVADQYRVEWFPDQGTGNWEKDDVNASNRFTFTPKKVYWKDIESIDVIVQAGDDAGGANWEECLGSGCTAGPDVASGFPYISRAYYVFRANMNALGRVPGDNGIRMTFNHKKRDVAELDLPYPTLWGDTCHDSDIPSPGDDNDQYLAALVHFRHFDSSDTEDPLKTNPNANDAYVDRIQFKLCDDDKTGGSLSKTQVVRVIVRARTSCKYIVQTATTGDQGAPLAKAWANRVQPTSAYKVPDLGVQYNNDDAPFGSAHPILGGTPETWQFAPANGQYLTGFPVREKRKTLDVRAGTPYALEDATTSPAKYCFAPNSPTAPNWTYGTDISTVDLHDANPCATSTDINNCYASDSSAEGNACSGPPVGRCSGNVFRQCDTDDDCRSAQGQVPVFNDGTCTAGNIQQYPVGWSEAKQRIQRLFAKSYGCWQYEPSIGPTSYTFTPVSYADQSKGTPIVVNAHQVKPAYTNTCDVGGTWDVATDSDAGQCPGNVRPPELVCDTNHNTACTAETADADCGTGVRCVLNPEPSKDNYCYVRPSITDTNISGLTSGTLQLALYRTATAQFRYTTDIQQAPAKYYQVLWECKEGQPCSCTPPGDVVVGAQVSASHQYTATGLYTPKICLWDSWDVLGEASLPKVNVYQP